MNENVERGVEGRDDKYTSQVCVEHEIGIAYMIHPWGG